MASLFYTMDRFVAHEVIVSGLGSGEFGTAVRSLPVKRNNELVKFSQYFMERSSLLRSLCIEGFPPFKEGVPLKLTSLILHHWLRGFFFERNFPYQF